MNTHQCFKYFSLRKIKAKIKLIFQQRRARKNNLKLIMHFKNESAELFHRIATLFDRNDIVYWLEYGSLLGYYRHNDYLPNDNDFDFGAYLKDSARIKDILLANGFELVRYYKDINTGAIEECYRYGNMHITFDIFYFTVKGDMLLTSGFKPILNMNIKANLGKEVPFCVRAMEFPYTEFKKIVFKGESVYIPVNTKEHLAAHYGPDFMTPKSHFNNNTANNVTIYSYDERPAIGWMKYGYYELV